MERDIWKELRPVTVWVSLAYIIFVLITIFADPPIDIPWTSLRLVPAITMVLLVAGITLMIIDGIRIVKTPRGDK